MHRNAFFLKKKERNGAIKQVLEDLTNFDNALGYTSVQLNSYWHNTRVRRENIKLSSAMEDEETDSADSGPSIHTRSNPV